MATRVCPECHSQYVASVRICIDCDVALVDEGGPEQPGQVPATPVGQGEQVAYELPGWGNQLKVSLEGMLDRAGIRRAWESGALVVPAEFEAEVDRLVATVEGGDVAELDDDVDHIAFEIEGLDADEVADLEARLIAAHLSHAWDEDGSLVVAETDEAEVAVIVEEVLEGGGEEELDGLAVQQALSTLYVALDKLMKAPDDDKQRARFLAAGAVLAELPIPYGLSDTEWEQVTADVDALADQVGATEGAAPADGTDGAGVAGDPGPDTDPDVEPSGEVHPSVADRARSLRTRLQELV